MGAGHFGWWWLSGVVLAAAFVPVALFGPRRPLAQFGVIIPVLLIVTVFCTATEAYLFVPSYRQYAVRNLVGATVMYLIVAAVLTLLTSVLKLNQQFRFCCAFIVHRGHDTDDSGCGFFLCDLLPGLRRDHLSVFHQGLLPEATQAGGAVGFCGSGRFS